MKVIISKIIDKKTVKAYFRLSKKHHKYGKFYSVQKSFLIHNQGFEVNIGQIVEIESSRPYSRQKKWVLKNII